MNVRTARLDDRYPSWLWANDATTRDASGDRPVIAWADHCRWFASRVDSPSAVILIGESAEGQPVGSIRFESADGWTSAVLSYVVAPEARGRGFGRALLVEGTAAVRRLHPDVRLEAQVLAGNQRSRRLFALLGWTERPIDDARVLFSDIAEAAV